MGQGIASGWWGPSNYPPRAAPLCQPGWVGGVSRLEAVTAARPDETVPARGWRAPGPSWRPSERKFTFWENLAYALLLIGWLGI